MRTSYQEYLTLTLSPYEAGVLKTILERIEIDDSGDASVNGPEDVLLDLHSAVSTYDAVDFPTRYFTTVD
jgi:hypothetical protein